MQPTLIKENTVPIDETFGVEETLKICPLTASRTGILDGSPALGAQWHFDLARVH